MVFISLYFSLRISVLEVIACRNTVNAFARAQLVLSQGFQLTLDQAAYMEGMSRCHFSSGQFFKLMGVGGRKLEKKMRGLG